MRSFIQQHLDPATRVGEVLFGLIMALGVTGAVRVGLEQQSNREMIVAVLGCNLAWGIVDGVMFVMLALFERSRKARIVRGVLAAASEEAALLHIGSEFDDRLEPMTNPEERRQIYVWILEMARRSECDHPRLKRADILGGMAVALLVLLATMPVLVPFLIIANPTIATRVSSLTALVMLFWLGTWWGRAVGAEPFRIGAYVTGVGVALVLVTIALGG